jgi:hypothetical protein
MGAAEGVIHQYPYPTSLLEEHLAQDMVPNRPQRGSIL